LQPERSGREGRPHRFLGGNLQSLDTAPLHAHGFGLLGRWGPSPWSSRSRDQA
jgi:hypothetical protein